MENNTGETATTVNTVEIEFPSILLNDEYYTLDLTSRVQTVTYKKIFIEEDLARDLYYGEGSPNLSRPELWIVRNNHKYDYLIKKSINSK